MAGDMDSGGVAMKTIVGRSGEDARSDIQISIEPGSGLEINSIVDAIYGDAIRDQVTSAVAETGKSSLRVSVVDSGALPFVIDARLDVAFAEHFGLPLRDLPPVSRQVKRERPRRTRLYIPGNNPKFIVNCGLYGADGIIFDLEDSVAAPDKKEARALVRRALANVDLGGSEAMVRVNSGETGHEDLRVLANAGVEVFLLPKTEVAEDVVAADRILTEAGSDALLLPILETALGVHFAYDIARASERVVGISIGVEDYVADICAKRTAEGTESVWAHGQVLNSARAAKVSAFASVFAVIDDAEAMETYARKVADLGFDGVGCIHPGQVAPAHRGFMPAAEEIERARQIVSEFESADKGAIRVAGEMIDAPIYKRALRTLSRAGER